MFHSDGNKLPLKNISLVNICENDWRKLFAEALYKEMQLNRRTTQSIANWAHVNKRTVKYWLEGSCTPSSFSLIQLMAHSEYVRQLVLKVSGVQDSQMATLFFMSMATFLEPWIEHFPEK